MENIPDAPYIRAAESDGMEFVHDWLFGRGFVDEDGELVDDD